ncbi:hypothetical protein MKW98_000083 [Papaver atlanticum]|uniref:SKP1-like protein n=1 Tax=Papaver atlanticum TaxID=357466 RepID=A0AAD4S8U7_9MAGN|nr:hypothetical protein MKW98_000083 [Papaver atlanticum]
MSTSKMVTLKSSDGETFDVEESVALQSQTIKHIVEDDCADNGIPLPNVTSKILAKVIEYCRKHDDNAYEKEKDDKLKNWDAEFELLDLTCQTVADMIKGKSPEEIRKTFNIKNDFTREEEEEVRRENQWAFE